MNPKELKLAASLLRLAAEEFGNHGCNDWDFPTNWTKKERATFVKEYYEWNGTPEDFNPKHLFLEDFAVMEFIAHKLSPDK